MKIAFVEDGAGARFWALVNSEAGTAQQVNAPFAEWVKSAANGSQEMLDLTPTVRNLTDLRLLAPVNPGARVFGVGLNYITHLTRLGRKEAPPHTIAYIKPESAIIHPDDEIQYPAVTAKLDYEVELVAVVASALGDAPCASACLLGYTVGNDISARDAGKQLGSLDLFTQKALDRTAPIGPWITTLDALGGAGQPQLDISLSINGELRQSDNSREMIFPMDELLNYLDARIELRPGDLIFTGSTCGVGLEDGRFLQPGDLIEAEIRGIGVLRNRVGLKRVLSRVRAVGRLGIGI
ncbi:fumarylacetoacetate hydrolase family protein [Glaciimonas immobilis]|uniref:2-keto-4-pentenoate hydratase/2-oxohepta-3-ene-1,7-dioic acid hydratase in catechol pathway n=1 Tax=Glaciimonas immobilis TaxID=728004 RepID=A0A840RZC9_9BURK|nr:fumarylacetoacetate hydrolase family protein [Glaciimonas immobilis]KAF3996138.1 fumarylacetoacetate hydrolase family protein [Glaciimonas immobilis]MBB5201709.1 2-keto-4-pentenoate hydratase/2-oxohepta-3-ene-1,7-dioic acid hydratase in catechol pathway [Glaciimonas immobilis]